MSKSPHVHEWAMTNTGGLSPRVDHGGKSMICLIGLYVCLGSDCDEILWRTEQRIALDPETGQLLGEEREP